MREIVQKTFWAGVVNDIRSTLPGAVFYAENLDVGRGKSVKQVVNNQAENACAYDVDYYITREIQIGTDIYGLGQDNETNRDTTIWKKTNSLSGNWGIVTNGTISGSTFNGGYALFVANNGIIYFDGGNSKVAKYTIATNTMSATAINLANAKGGVVWQGNVYCWSGQAVYKINTSNDALTEMITIPSEQTIVELVPYGNLLAVVCTSSTTASKMYLWDGVTTTTFTEILEIGWGTVSGGSLLEGTIVVAINTPNKRTLKLKGYSGGNFINLFTYTGRYNQAGTFNYIQPASSLKTFTGYVYFIVTGTKPDGTYSGTYEYAIARFGREEPSNPMTFSIYKTLDFTSARSLDGQTTNNDFTIIETIVGGADTTERAVAAFINSASLQTTFFLSSTNTYSSQAGVLETLNINADKSWVSKKMKVVSAQYEPLPSGGKAVLKYRNSEDTYWTTIFVDSTQNSISHEAVNIESYTDAATITIASPAVVTLTDHRLVPGQVFRFNTTGALPTGITAGTDYYVLATSITADTFRFSATAGGSAVNTSGSQSGVHTIDRTQELPIFKDTQLRIELLGGAELTGWSMKVEDLNGISDA